MSQNGNGGGYKYYDYLNKYDARFLNKYQSWGHHLWNRRSNYLQLLYFRAYSLYTGRNILLPHMKLKKPYMLISALICVADIYGSWIFQEMYNKYVPWKWTYYQPYFKESCLLME